MEIVYLILRDRRSLEYGESCVCEYRLVRLARRPVLARHVAVVGGRSAPSEPVAFIVRAHAVEAIAPCHLSLNVIDVGQFSIRRRALVVVAVLVEPRNRIRARTTVRRRVVLRNGRGATLRRRLCVKQVARQLHPNNRCDSKL